MRRTYRFARPAGRAACQLESGRTILLPLFPGILRHPTTEELERLLADPAVARKYTREALRMAPWPLLREFPRDWLLECLVDRSLPVGRRRALDFLLREEHDSARRAPESPP